MQILGYFIPQEFRDMDFIQSLALQLREKGKLSPKQQNALLDVIGVELDFWAWDLDPDTIDEEFREDYILLLKKYRRNRFRAPKGRNRCIRAMLGVIDGHGDQDAIDTALGRNFDHNRHNQRRWRYGR